MHSYCGLKKRLQGYFSLLLRPLIGSLPLLLRPIFSFLFLFIAASTWEIRNLKKRVDAEPSSCLVTHMLEIHSKRWCKWKRTSYSKFEKTIPYALLLQVAGYIHALSSASFRVWTQKKRVELDVIFVVSVIFIDGWSHSCEHIRRFICVMM